jgi:hypothetical protein
MFVTVDIFSTEFVNTFIICVQTKFHAPVFIRLLVAAIRTMVIQAYRFHTASMLLSYFLKRKHLNKGSMVSLIRRSDSNGCEEHCLLGHDAVYVGRYENVPTFRNNVLPLS